MKLHYFPANICGFELEQDFFLFSFLLLQTQSQIHKLSLCVYQKPTFFVQTLGSLVDCAMQISGYALPTLPRDRRTWYDGSIYLGDGKQRHIYTVLLQWSKELATATEALL